MLTGLESILRDQCGLAPDRAVLAAVSGGADSLCLLDVIRRAGYPVVVAHFNHRLREESEAEAANVSRLAESLGLPFVVGRADVREHASRMNWSLEAAARNLRYAFLFEQARAQGAQAVAAGHTADDQVETILMHLLRGSGLTGLKGMAHRTILTSFDPNIPLVRPLLDTWREETRAYCAAQGFTPVNDPSNDSFNFARNRIRHLLIPTLETYNPKFRAAAHRAAQLLHDDHRIVRDAVTRAWQDTLVVESAHLIAFDSRSLLGLPRELQRHLLKRAFEQVAPGEEITFAVIERAVSFLDEARASVGLSLPGRARLVREVDRVYVAASGAVLPFERWPQLPADADRISVPLPGAVSLAGGWSLTAERWGIPMLAHEQMQANADPLQVWVDPSRADGALSVRVRHDGDRFAPLGMGGHTQKLSDFFTNIKIPRRARPRWPLVCLGEAIVWVAGRQLAEPFRLTKDSRQILHLTLVPPKME
ncbi:MAG: tRNA(Ile)-lysidine synthase [Anaerolineales bacterium]|nr:tRNA(Ile)-lysidine synthase [Anaerolineales bacterium]